MKIETAIILCAGFGKRLNPITLKTPKPLILLNDITMLESCINTIKKLGVKKIFLNTFHLRNQIFEFIKNKNFSVEIKIVDDGNEILETGGGIFNMCKYFKDDDFIVFNPDTLWGENNVNELVEMQNFYFQKKLNNILLVVNKELSFDKNLSGDFELKNDLLQNNRNKDFIYTGCQILNRNLFEKYKKKIFSVSEIWNELLKENKLNGFKSSNKFYHLTNLDIFKKLRDL
jgi:MurNAc alpha-1-phosphate uridylyltransferase